MLNKDKALFHWKSFPLLDKPKMSILVFSVIIFVAWILWQLAIVQWDQPLYYILGIVILFLGIFPYFVPTEYYFFENDILVQYPIIKIEKKYSDFGCFYVDKNGIMLSTFKRPRRLDSFRGQSIRFSKTQKERNEIIPFLKEKIGKQF
jgi:hypothetical protein